MTGEITSSFNLRTTQLFSFFRGDSPSRQLKTLVAEANRSAALAGEEKLLGERMLGELEKAAAANDPVCYRRNLSQRAVWHLRSSANKYREAAAEFAAAAEFTFFKRNRKKLQAKAADLWQCAENLDATVNSIWTYYAAMRRENDT